MLYSIKEKGGKNKKKSEVHLKIVRKLQSIREKREMKLKVPKVQTNIIFS